MSARERRANIVALTLSELMLIVAVVFLVLFTTLNRVSAVESGLDVDTGLDQTVDPDELDAELDANLTSDPQAAPVPVRPGFDEHGEALGHNNRYVLMRQVYATRRNDDVQGQYEQEFGELDAEVRDKLTSDPQASLDPAGPGSGGEGEAEGGESEELMRQVYDKEQQGDGQGQFEQEPVDLDEEVREKLVPQLLSTGDIDSPQDDAESQLVSEKAVDKAVELLTQKQELEQEVDQILTEAGVETDGDRVGALRELLGEMRSAQDGQEIANLSEGQSGVLSGGQLSERRLRNEVGFVPCWRGGNEGKRYYFAFDITFSGDRYAIEPNADWNSSNENVRKDIGGRLPALSEYPRGQVDKETLVAYAQKLNDQKEGVYGRACKLATTINRKANGEIINEITNRMSVFPVYR